MRRLRSAARPTLRSCEAARSWRRLLQRGAGGAGRSGLAGLRTGDASALRAVVAAAAASDRARAAQAASTGIAGLARIAAGAGRARGGLDDEMLALDERRQGRGIDHDPAVAAASALAALAADAAPAAVAAILRFGAAADPRFAVAAVPTVTALAAILALAAALPRQIDDQAAVAGEFADAQHDLAGGGAFFARDARAAGRAVPAVAAFLHAVDAARGLLRFAGRRQPCSQSEGADDGVAIDARVARDTIRLPPSSTSSPPLKTRISVSGLDCTMIMLPTRVLARSWK